MVKTSAMLNKWNTNFSNMIEKDMKSKKEKKLVGRYISHPVADGSAFYLITRENKKTVSIELVRDIGDDYRTRYWGEKATIQKVYAKQEIQTRDKLAQMFLV